MNPSERIKLQAGWVLHRRDFRDSSQIVEVFTREHGRLSMVARGVKRPRSRHRGVLQPFAPLLLSWVSGRELATMTDVEQGEGKRLTLVDDRLLCGFYVNELVLKLTHRFDPQPGVYALYEHVLAALDGATPAAIVLRDFELRLLGELGFGLNLTRDAGDGSEISEARYYDVIVDQGPVAVADGDAGRDAVRGGVLIKIANGDWADAETRRVARVLLGRAIDLQLDGKQLHTRRIMRDVWRAGAAE